MSFITCAAPFASAIGKPQAGDLLQKRIHRVLVIARAYGYTTLVLGVWGCGAFHNDPHRTASGLRSVLGTDFDGAFFEVVFTIKNWSSDKRSLGVFCNVFAAGEK